MEPHVEFYIVEEARRAIHVGTKLDVGKFVLMYECVCVPDVAAEKMHLA